MSTGSSPSAFDEFANATLRLPDSLREFLRWPMGPLVSGADILPTIGRASPVATVGDFCTLDLVARGRTPDVCVVDFKTKRQEDPELREALSRVGTKALRVTNPAGTIVADAWRVMSEAFKSDERVRVEVRGEEDLLALVCIALAPGSAAVLYGLPSQGVVVVKPDQSAKAKVLDILRRMER
ncbi:MAG TPA: GTP-dependent dephospho-CoA kinase family protein [Thermoplasmata archaeon]|nr:GTP-dependent dephospho-CoA kinase family protein [Thermoplasmata archaeon]